MAPNVSGAAWRMIRARFKSEPVLAYSRMRKSYTNGGPVSAISMRVPGQTHSRAKPGFMGFDGDTMLFAKFEVPAFAGIAMTLNRPHKRMKMGTHQPEHLSHQVTLN